MIICIEDLNIEALKWYSEKIDSAKWEHIDFIFASNWGDVSVADFLTRMINNLSSATVYVDFLWSSAIDTVRNINHKKVLLNGAHGVYHCEAWAISMASKSIARWPYEKFKLSTMEDVQPLDWLTDEENEGYCGWVDIHFATERLKEVLNIQ